MVVVKDPQEETGPFVVRNVCFLVALNHPFGIWSWQQAQPKTHRVEAPDQTAQRTPAQTNRKEFRHARRHHNLSFLVAKMWIDNILVSMEDEDVQNRGGPRKRLFIFWVCLFAGQRIHLHSLKLTVRPWKWMVGIQFSFRGRAYVQVQTVSFRDYKFLLLCLHVSRKHWLSGVYQA